MEKENKNNVIKAYKGFNKDLKCRGFQYEIGKEYKHNGEVKACKSGFHACENPLDVLEYYGDIDCRFCEVEQSGVLSQETNKMASSEIKIVSEIGFVGLFKAGVEWIKKITNPQEIIKNTKVGDGDSQCDSAQIGSSGDSAKIGSSGNYARILSTGEDSVICCAGYNSKVKAKKGSWITLSEWRWSDEKKRTIPKYVKTEYVDGERIKADTWYKLVNGEFIEVEE